MRSRSKPTIQLVSLGEEEGQKLAAAAHAELIVDVRQMGFDRVLAYVQRRQADEVARPRLPVSAPIAGYKVWKEDA